MHKPTINPEYNVLTLVNMLSTAMHGDLNTDQWEQYFAFDAKMLSDIQDLLQKINDWHVVDNAEGSTLDLLGNDFGVARNGDDDEMYRFRIKSKRFIRISDGTCNSIYRVVSSCLGIPPTDFHVHGNNLPNQVVIDGIDANQIDNGRKVLWLMEQAENAVAYGIKIADIVFHLSENMNLYMGTAIDIAEHVVSNVGPTITDKESVKEDSYIGIAPSISESTVINAGNSIIERHTESLATLKFGIAVLEPYVFRKEQVEHFSMSIGDGIISHTNINISNHIGNTFNVGSRIQI